MEMSGEAAALNYKPDLQPYEMQIKSDYYKTEVAVTDEQKEAIEEETRGQANCARWYEERSKRITASFAKKIARRRENTPCASLVKEIVYPKDVRRDAIEWGIKQEPIARALYERRIGRTVRPCGLFVDKHYPFLAASPDGFVQGYHPSYPYEPYVIEIYCPYAAQECNDISKACETLSDFPLRKDSPGNFSLNENDKFYFQVQMQMQCAGVQICDFVVYIPKDLKFVPIHRNQAFIDEIIPKFAKFYFECILPELVDPRDPKGLPIREPQQPVGY